MAENNAPGSTWPMPKFRFAVDLSDELKDIPFLEVSGMEAENEIVEFRKNDHPVAPAEKTPGITKYGNITLRHGVFPNGNTFWDWHAQVSMSTMKRKNILIKLFDQEGKVISQWQLNNAWPTKITSTDLRSDGNEVAVDTIEIAHEQLIATTG